MNIDKIPLEKAKIEGGQKRLFGIALTPAEEANAEKINQIIDMLRDLQTRVENIENK
mgnify:CR=1 FL=1